MFCNEKQRLHRGQPSQLFWPRLRSALFCVPGGQNQLGLASLMDLVLFAKRFSSCSNPAADSACAITVDQAQIVAREGMPFRAMRLGSIVRAATGRIERNRFHVLLHQARDCASGAES